jgi:hypothetical protein
MGAGDIFLAFPGTLYAPTYFIDVKYRVLPISD